MRTRTSFLSFLTVLLLSFIGSCVSPELKRELDSGDYNAAQHNYAEAYEHYEQALSMQPDNEEIQAKKEAMGRKLADDYNEKAYQAINDKQYKTAQGFLKKALEYDEGNSRARALKETADTRYDEIMAMYAKADGLAARNSWVEATTVLNEIDARYNDDPDIGAKIEEWQEKGYNYYMSAGRRARQNGDYKGSLAQFESANALRPDPQSARELERAQKYVEADEHYLRAERYADQRHLLKAMEELIAARAIVDDHTRANQLYGHVLPNWSAEAFETARAHYDAGRPWEAFVALAKLYEMNPDYPGTKTFYEETKSVCLEINYKGLMEAQRARAFATTADHWEKISKLDPSFLDAKEIGTRASLKAFSVFLQKGHHYMRTGNYGKAILCFRSAERELAESELTQRYIREALEKIREHTALRVALWGFSQDVGDPGLCADATKALRKRLNSELQTRKFKNISFRLDNARGAAMTDGACKSSEVQWADVREQGCNRAIAGTIRVVNTENAVNSQWKIRKRNVEKQVENKEYMRLMGRRAYLNGKLDRRDIRGSEKKEIRAELEEIEKTLLTIPPWETVFVEEKTPYQETIHILTAQIQLDAGVETKEKKERRRYLETFRTTDLVKPPDLDSGTPGDPLELPTHSEFERESIAKLIAQKVFPDLMQEFEEYGLSFLEEARRLYDFRKQRTRDSLDFFNAIEEYYKFLVCYEGQGTKADLTEEVEEFMNSCVSDPALIHRPRTAAHTTGGES